MVNYNNIKIYKIWSPCGSKIYIGATTKEYLSQRMHTHRQNYKRGSSTTSKILFDEYDIENCFIELIESKECKDKHEARQLEGHYIRTLECVNKKIECRTQKEYQIDNQDKIKEYNKKYNKEYQKTDKRKEYNKEYQKKYNEVNKEIIKNKIKNYNEVNKEMIKERRKQYYLKNKLKNAI